jgi:hypothetical protein
MEIYYAQVGLLSNTGASADTAVNTFSIQHSGTLSTTDVDAWQTAIKQFYDDCKAAGALLGRQQLGHTSKFLKATKTKPNYPLFTRTWNLSSAPTALELPNEVALCVSYSADAYPLVPRARRRGRIYISGWGSAKNTVGRPTDAARDALALAYKTYATSVLAITNIGPGVWSRSTGDVYLIDRTWVDNEWDTMRSRGGKSTGRKTYSI